MQQQNNFSYHFSFKVINNRKERNEMKQQKRKKTPRYIENNYVTKVSEVK